LLLLLPHTITRCRGFDDDDDDEEKNFGFGINDEDNEEGRGGKGGGDEEIDCLNCDDGDVVDDSGSGRGSGLNNDGGESKDSDLNEHEEGDESLYL